MADKLKINLRYCYGIGKMEAELEFKHKGFAIYAPKRCHENVACEDDDGPFRGQYAQGPAFPRS